MSKNLKTFNKTSKLEGKKSLKNVTKNLFIDFSENKEVVDFSEYEKVAKALFNGRKNKSFCFRK